MTALDRKIANRLEPLIAKAESGADWAEIARLEAEMIEDELEAEMIAEEQAEANGQFGVGA